MNRATAIRRMFQKLTPASWSQQPRNVRATPATAAPSPPSPGSSNGPQRRTTPEDGVANAAVRAKLSRATEDELRSALTEVNRLPVFKGQPQRALPVLQEIRNRVAYVTPHNFRDALIVANGSGHHDIALDLFFKRFETHKGDPHFSMPDAVVDSAFALESLPLLSRLCETATDRMRLVPDDYPTDIAISRLLWRIACFRRRSGATKRANGGVAASVSAEAVEATFLKAWACVLSYNVSLAQRSVDPVATFRTLARFVWYSDRDSGEMNCFAHLSSLGTMNCAKDRPLQYFVNALRSCKSGKWDDKAQSYFDEYGSRHGGFAGDYDEVMLHTFLTVLQAAKAYERIAALGRLLLLPEARGRPISATVLSLIAQGASEAGATDVVDAAFSYVSREAAGLEGRGVSKFAAFACLVALGKCGRHDYMTFVDDFCQRGLIDVSCEGRVFLTLQYAVHAADPSRVAADSVAAVATDPACQTERVFNQLLQLQLRVDDDALLATFQQATSRGFFRAPWIELLVTWADRKRYELRPEQRQAVLRVVAERRGVQLGDDEELAGSEGAAGLRPMLGLLNHDAKHGVGLSTGDAPKFVDPRVYFLRTKHGAALDLCSEGARDDASLKSSVAASLQRANFDGADRGDLTSSFFIKATRQLQRNDAPELSVMTRARSVPTVNC